MDNSKLNINIVINERGLTPDPTHVDESLSMNVKAPAVSLSRKQYTASQQARVYKNGYSGANDKMFYLKNIGDTSFSIQEGTNGGAAGNTYGALGIGDVMLFRLKAGYDIWLTNLSSADNGKVEWSFWECTENA